MLVRVIYTDQTAGVVESHLLDGLIKKGRIVAYHHADRWIPVASKAHSGVGGISSVTLYDEDPLCKKLH
jgi:hypothetical protein